MNKLFNNNPTAKVLIGGLVVLLILFWANRSDAEGVTRFEIGPTAVSGKFSDGVAVMVSEVFNDRYLVGFGLIGQQTFRGEQIGNNIMFRAQLLVQGPSKWAWSRNLELGAGLGYFEHQNKVLGSNLNFFLSLGYESPDHWSRWVPDRFTYDHASNSGSAHPNPGQDFIVMFGYDFGY